MPNSTLPANCDLIRKAWRKGERQVTLEVDGRLVKLDLSVELRSVNFISGGEHVKREERWIIAKPSDGAFYPVLSCEQDRYSNMRTAR